ncbi:Uncharacterized protein C1F7.10 [Candida viswanathii]|uniref:Uncharacterized protein C1F7.10 n=1 Tax=Candida viswanathii TaxID=5486 RepID=A0A367XWU4_9ASCO|nr:Uncharacterized protein C1F7.10 [Candida viswanathii]
MQILVINPNSSYKVTRNLEKTVHAPESVKLHFYTAPSDSPAEITPKNSLCSESAVLKDFTTNEALKEYDAFLVCCYSDHPLVQSLAQITHKPVLGIMQATLLYALLMADTKLFILTSTSDWEPVLDQGIIDFVGTDGFPPRRFYKTRGLNVNVTNLADEEQFAKIYKVTKAILEEYDDTKCVLLGCAGMAGLDKKLGDAFPGIRFVDSVKVGVQFLESLVRFDRDNKK